MAALNVTVFLRQQMLASAGYPLVEINENGAKSSAETLGGVLNPLPDYWIARLHKQLMGTTVLGIASSAADIRVYAHCALGGGVTMAFLNIALKNSVNVTLPEALAAAPAREEFMLTAGAPIKGAKNPLQSKVVLLNGTPLQLVPPPGGGWCKRRRSIFACFRRETGAAERQPDNSGYPAVYIWVYAVCWSVGGSVPMSAVLFKISHFRINDCVVEKKK